MKKQQSAAEAFPLCWPDGWERTHRRKDSGFRVTGFGRVRDGVVRELRLMGAKSVIVSSNIPLRRDGLPYANMPNPEDPGIAVYWYDWRSRQSRCIACDRWHKAIDNTRAIEKSLQALRGLDRWGSTEIVSRVFSGFAALPPASHRDWRSVFGFGGGVRPAWDEVRTRHHELAVKAHPDHGGSSEEMMKLNLALQEAKKELRA